MRLADILNIGVINTLRMNYKYFGWDGVRHVYILASRRLRILRLDGEIVPLKALKKGSIWIGFDRAGIFDSKYERAMWQNAGTIYVAGKVNLGQGVRLSNSGQLHFGENMSILANSTVVCKKDIRFGDNILVSWDCLIMDSDFHKIYNKSGDGTQINEPQAISIGDHVWIGCRSTILKGAGIPDGSIVAAGSIISKEFEQKDTIVGGVNRVLAKDVFWEA